MLHRLLGSYFISMLYIIEAESQYVHDSQQFVKHTKLCRQSTQHRCWPGGWPFSRRRNVSVETTLSSASLSSRVQPLIVCAVLDDWHFWCNLFYFFISSQSSIQFPVQCSTSLTNWYRCFYELEHLIMGEGKSCCWWLALPCFLYAIELSWYWIFVYELRVISIIRFAIITGIFSLWQFVHLLIVFVELGVIALYYSYCFTLNFLVDVLVCMIGYWRSVLSLIGHVQCI